MQLLNAFLSVMNHTTVGKRSLSRCQMVEEEKRELTKNNCVESNSNSFLDVSEMKNL